MTVINLNHQAIYKAYPNVVRISGSKGAFDADGNEVEIDPAVVEPFVADAERESSMSFLRKVRNSRLVETDHYALVDATLTDEMRAYRQALRDLPANTADPANPVWPVKPGGTN